MSDDPQQPPVLPPRRPPRSQPPTPAAPPKRGSRAWFLMKRAERQRRQDARDVVEALEAAGVTARVLQAAEALKSPFYHRAINVAIKRRESKEGKLTRLDPVRSMAMRILEQDFGCDLDGVDVAVRWEPSTAQLSCRAGPSVPAMAAALKTVTDRRKEPPPAE